METLFDIIIGFGGIALVWAMYVGILKFADGNGRRHGG